MSTVLFLKMGYLPLTFQSWNIAKKKESVLAREEYYFRLLKPEYNISTTPSASFLGLTHSPITRAKTGLSKLGNRYGEASPLSNYSGKNQKYPLLFFYT